MDTSRQLYNADVWNWLQANHQDWAIHESKINLASLAAAFSVVYKKPLRRILIHDICLYLYLVMPLCSLHLYLASHYLLTAKLESCQCSSLARANKTFASLAKEQKRKRFWFVTKVSLDRLKTTWTCKIWKKECWGISGSGKRLWYCQKTPICCEIVMRWLVNWIKLEVTHFYSIWSSTTGQKWGLALPQHTSLGATSHNLHALHGRLNDEGFFMCCELMNACEEIGFWTTWSVKKGQLLAAFLAAWMDRYHNEQEQINSSHLPEILEWTGIICYNGWLATWRCLPQKISCIVMPRICAMVGLGLAAVPNTSTGVSRETKTPVRNR